VGNLLEQFEANEQVNEDLERRKQIVAAVQSHFAKSPRKMAPGKGTKIGECHSYGQK